MLLLWKVFLASIPSVVIEILICLGSFCFSLVSYVCLAVDPFYLKFKFIGILSSLKCRYGSEVMSPFSFLTLIFCFFVFSLLSRSCLGFINLIWLLKNLFCMFDFCYHYFLLFIVFNLFSI